MVVIFLLMVIITLLFQVQVVVRERIEAFEENPLLFGAAQYNVDQCSCSNNNGNQFFFNQDKIWIEQEGSYSISTTNISNYKFILTNAS